MQWRVDEADHDRQPIHRVEHLAEITLLIWQELVEGLFSSGSVVREDHVLHDREALGLPEHVLRAREAYTLGAQLSREPAFSRRVGIDPDPEAPALVRPREQLDQVFLFPELRLDGRQLAGEDLAGRSVDRDRIALFHYLSVDVHLAFHKIDIERGDPCDTRQAETAGHDGRVGGRTATRGKDPGGRHHSMEVIGARLGTHEHHELFLTLKHDGTIGVENGAAGRRAG